MLLLLFFGVIPGSLLEAQIPLPGKPSPSATPAPTPLEDTLPTPTPAPSVTPTPTSATNPLQTPDTPRPDSIGLSKAPQAQDPNPYTPAAEIKDPPTNPTFPDAPKTQPDRSLDLLPFPNTGSDVTPSSFIPWAKREFMVVAQGKPIGAVITDLCEQQGIKAIIHQSVQGTVSGTFQGKDPARTLDQLCRSFNLMWYYNQGALYVYGTPDLISKIRTMYFGDPQHVISLLRAYGVITSDGGVTTVPESRSLMISGPADFVKMVDSIATSVDSAQQFHQQGETVIEVFPLKYAWAYDIPLGPSGSGQGASGSSTVITGVATVLNNLVNGGGTPNNGQQFTTLGVPRPVQGALSPKDLASTAINGFYTPQQGSGGNTGQPRPGSAIPGSPGSGSGPDGGQVGANGLGSGPASQPYSMAQITADVRRNAVVIRDIRENMAFYKRAIEQLDVPVKIIQISAAVIDVQAGMGRTLGVDGVAVNGAGYGVGGSATGNNRFLSGLNGLGSSLGSNSSSSSAINASQNGAVNNAPNILGSGVFGTTRITATINALESENKARTLSRPTVMTLDNFGANINNQQTFYVSSTGQYVSNLFNISSGLSLQVVPHIIHGKKGEEIYMQVQIADGQINSQQVGQLPTVTQSTLTTQSLVKKEQSLLIGGLFIKVDQKQASGYPWLRKIPVMGALFSVTNSNKNVVERLFLITPKIIELSNKNLGDYSPYFQPSPTEADAMKEESDPANGPQWVEENPPGLPRVGPLKPTPAPTPKKRQGLFGLFRGKPTPDPTPSPKPIPAPKVSPSPAAKGCKPSPTPVPRKKPNPAPVD